ncbi:MAG: TAXI family TRAP transporter solute-binding subunit [Clostridia bacterium]|nr:TAXI family TRAP transporter solute-binding subunit [Clostridia bacterium]
MKRKMFLVSVCILLCGLLTLGVCNPVSGAQSSKTNFTVGGGPQGGGWYGLAGQLAAELEAVSAGKKFSVMPGGGIGNIDLTERGEMDISTTVSHLYRSALDSIDPYAGKTYHSLTALGNIGTSDTCLFLIKASVPVNSIQELVDRKYPINLVTTTRASTPFLGAERILAEFGITADDLKSWGGSMQYLSYTDGCMLIADGHADGIIAPVVAAITELQTTTPLKVLPLEESMVDSLVAKFGYAKNHVKGGTYGFMTEDFLAIGEPNILLCRSDLPDEVAYSTAKLLCEKPEIITAWGTHHATFVPAMAPTSIGGPLHPGAEQYYKEAGYLK